MLLDNRLNPGEVLMFSNHHLVKQVNVSPGDFLVYCRQFLRLLRPYLNLFTVCLHVIGTFLQNLLERNFGRLWEL